MTKGQIDSALGSEWTHPAIPESTLFPLFSKGQFFQKTSFCDSDSLLIIPSKEHPGLISFRMDWLDLLAVPGTLKSLLQYHSSKASILLCSAFFSQLHSSHTLVMEKAMAPHSSTLAWKIPWTEEPGGLLSMGSHRVGHD